MPPKPAWRETFDRQIAKLRPVVARVRGRGLHAREMDLDAFGATPLHRAAFRSDIAEVRALLDSGADVDARNNNGLTPLHSVTARAGADVAVCRLLIERGADVNAAADNERRPLHGAAAKNRADICELLLERGADPNAMALSTVGMKEGGGSNLSDNAVTPLHLAARMGAMEACRVLIKHGAQSFWVQEDNAFPAYLTPFQLVIRTGPIAMVKFFVEECGEDLSQVSLSGKTLLELAPDGSEQHVYLLSQRTEHMVLKSMQADAPSSVASGRRREADPL